MGTDIHLYVEKRKKGSKSNFKNAAFRSEFSHRIYAMFVALADVRWGFDINPLTRRGLPNDIAPITFDNIFSRVVKEYKKEYEEEYYYLEEDIEEDIKKGESFIWEIDGKKLCSNPDWHTFSWCTPDEMAN